jgi:hypothetical protein
MSWTLILNGTTHTLPDSGEEGWATEVNAYLLDIVTILSGTWQTVTVTGAATTVDFNNGKNVRLLLGANTAITFTNPRAGKPAFFKVKNTGAYSVTWPANVLWSAGTEPTNTSGNGKVDTFAFIYDNVDMNYLGEYSLDKS